MQNIPLSKLIALLMVVVVGGVVTLAAWSYSSTQKIKIGSALYSQIIESNDVVADILPPPQYIVEAFLLVHQLRSASPEQRVGLKKRFDETYTELQQGHERWLKSDLPKELKTAITQNTFNPAADFYKEAEQHFLPALAVNDEDTLNKSMQKLADYYQQNRAAVNDLVVASVERKADLEKLTQAEHSHYVFWFFTVAIIVVLISLFIAFNVIAEVRRRLHEVTKVVRQLGHGDLGVRVDMLVQDEFGQIATEINAMSSQFKNIISQLRQSAEKLSISVSSISTASKGATSNTSDQRFESEQVSAAMTEMTATVHEVARNILSASHAARRATEETNIGTNLVQETVRAIKVLSTQISDASDIINRVESNTHSISSVLDVIKSIAEQTNLLALNAAIEAARAGEQGRGFAVVADEVRTLASRTQQSTGEINEMISLLQQGSKSSVDAMNKSCEQAGLVVNKAENAGKSLVSIAATVLEISDLSAQIATAAEEQTNVSEEINSNIVHINQAAIDTAKGALKTTVSVSQLELIAGELQQLVKQFKI